MKLVYFRLTAIVALIAGLVTLAWSINAASTAQTTPKNISIVNAGLEETASESLPKNWQHSQWGESTTDWTYLSTGRSGSRSVKVSVSNYQSGDAKWINDPAVLPAEKYYRFGVWYKTNATPHAVVQFETADGSTTYFGLPDPQPAEAASTTWQYYSDTFYIPAGTKTVTAFMMLTSNGWLETDDYAISPYSHTGFKRPVVTLTFDDAFEKNVTTALPLLANHDFKTTQCYATKYVEGNAIAEQIALKYRDAGHETCSHSVTHSALSQLSASGLYYELEHSRDYLQRLTGQPVTTFTSPFGDYDGRVTDQIAKFYASHRTTDEGLNSKDNFNPDRIRVQNLTPTTSLAQYQSWLDQAKATNTWLILVYHRIGPDDGTLTPYDTPDSEFQKQLAALKASGLPVLRYDAALAEIKA